MAMSATKKGLEPGLTRAHTICRACHAQCALIVELSDGRPVKIFGDKDNPVTKGFSCIKGRNLAAYREIPSRLTTSMKRVGDGFDPIAADQAIQEIGEKLKAIVEKHGPRSVAAFSGTFGVTNSLASSFLQHLLAAIGSPMFFTCATIDQPGKLIGDAVHGSWGAGWARDADALDVVLMIGHNPVVSLGGAFGQSPANNIVETRKRGLKLIVIDPRQSETARHADLFLQPRPGEDVTILAGIVRVILSESLHDAAFVTEEAQGLDALRAVVEPFTPDYVERRASVSAQVLVEAARTYAGGRRGLVICGTGPNMSPHGVLCEYLGRVITTLCGHLPRAGDPVGNPGVLIHPMAPATAATAGPRPGWGFGEKMRFHGLANTAAGMPLPVLPDEILTPGEGQVRALIVLGGNPLLAFPDQHKVFAAMQDLELLICIDPQISATARLGHYVLAPTLALEVPAVSSYNERVGTWGMIWGFDVPYAQYAPAIMPPPQGSDLRDDWQFLFGIAKAMGFQLVLKPSSFANLEDAAARAKPLDMARDYTTDEMLDLAFEGSPVPMSEVREKAVRGHVFDLPKTVVLPKPEGWTGKFELAHPAMVDELRDVAAEAYGPTPGYPFLLISRRLRDHYNSTWHDLDALKRQYPCSPAFMHPDDVVALGLEAGDIVSITSDAGEIMGVVELAPELRQGCVSMAHGWGVNPDEPEDPTRLGGCTSRLISTDRDCDPYSWMARQSSIPVKVTARKAALMSGVDLSMTPAPQG